MSFILTLAGYCAAAIAAALLALWGLLWLIRRRRPGRRYWLRGGGIGLVLVGLFTLGGVPLTLGWLVTRGLSTRGDERPYGGPRVVDGRWLPQTKEQFLAERRGEREVDAAVLDAAAARAVRFESADGTGLRGWWVPGAGRARCVLTHGLVRGALELEPVGAMLHDLGCDVLLVEVRNHGDSERAPTTFGVHEAQDLAAGYTWARAQPGPGAQRMLVFGVSMGAIAASLAAPGLPELRALVLDAPMDDAASTAERMLTAGPRPGRRGFRLVQPFRSLVLSSVEFWSGVSLADIRPIDRLTRLDPATRVLVVGGSEDQRMPPDVVRRVFDVLPQAPDHKTLWIRDGAEHGKVWLLDPDGYRRHLQSLLDAL